MDKQKQAIRQVLDTLERLPPLVRGVKEIMHSITALREALAEQAEQERMPITEPVVPWLSHKVAEQAEQEPVGHVLSDGTICWDKWCPDAGTLLYAAPQPVKQEPVAVDRDAFLDGYEAAQSDANFCDVPPQGWLCTRQAGHDGPCAAIADDKSSELVNRAMLRLAEHEAAPVRTKDLTDDDITLVAHETMEGDLLDLPTFARAIVTADREKNRA